jgi:hypothetical protein
MYLWGNVNFQTNAPTMSGALKFPTRAPVFPSAHNTDAATRNAYLASHAGFPSGSVTSHASGYNHHLFIVGGALYGFGSNHQNQLGSGVATYAATARAIPFRGRSAPVEVACGRRHSLIRTADGMVYTAGDNTHGQLGRSLGKQGGAGGGKQASAPVNSAMLDFAEVALGGVIQISAAENASFALTDKGALYSWGFQASGHLGHGDRGEGMLQTDKGEVMGNATVDRPTQVRWFSEKRVKLVQVSAGKEHVVARSETDVYTMGEGFYGKLGTNDVSVVFFPHRVAFPARKTPEKLVSIAAGNNHTVVLKHSGEMGSVVYHFGQVSGDTGSLVPVVVESPYNDICKVFAGSNCSMGAVTEDGTLLVWGDYGPLSNGLPKLATRTSRQTPIPVKALGDFHVVSFCTSGSTMIVFTDDTKASPARSQPVVVKGSQVNTIHLIDDEEEGEKKPVVSSTEGKDIEDADLVKYHYTFDTLVPISDRTGGRLAVDNFDEARQDFYSRWLGDVEGLAYFNAIPVPLEEVHAKKVLAKKGAHGLQAGDKVRLWMTDVYALAVVAEQPGGGSSSQLLSQSTDCDLPTQSLAEEKLPHQGHTYYLEWMRDDWVPEHVELFSDDETQDEENPNRWQSVWFVEAPSGGAVGV